MMGESDDVTDSLPRVNRTRLPSKTRQELGHSTPEHSESQTSEAQQTDSNLLPVVNEPDCNLRSSSNTTIVPQRPPRPARTNTEPPVTDDNASPCITPSTVPIIEILDVPDKSQYLEESSSERAASERQHRNMIDEEILKLREEILFAILSKQIKTLTIVVKQLKTLGGNLNYREGKDRQSLLHKCVIQKDSSDMISLLLESDANPDVSDIHARTPLHIATEKGDLEVIKLLLAAGANNMAKDERNQAPLHLATRFGHKACAEALLESRILINHQDHEGDSALHLAVRFEHVDIVELLLQRNADVLLLNKLGQRAIDILMETEQSFAKPNGKHKSRGKFTLSPSGKVIYKLLKKKGGNKQPSTVVCIAAIGAGIQRGKSLDHQAVRQRNGSLTHLGLQVHRHVNQAGASTSSLSPTGKGPEKYERSAEESHLSEKEDSLTITGGGIGTGTGIGMGIQSRSPRSISATTMGGSITSSASSTGPTEQLDRYGFVISERSKQAAKGKKPVSLKPSTKEDYESRAIKWIGYLHDWDTSLRKYRPKLLKLCDKGIPDSVRGQVWKSLAGLGNYNASIYHNLLKTQRWDTAIHEQILRDIHRTMPNHILFKEKGQGQQMLTNVLLAYSAYRPEVGYCQGMGFITAMFLMYMTEEDAFFMLDILAGEKYGMAGVWEEGFRYLKQCMPAFSHLLTQNYPKIVRKFEDNYIPLNSFSAQFFITGYLYNLPFNMAVRVWDCFWLRNFDYWYALGLSLFKLSKELLLKLDMELLMNFFQFKDKPAIHFDVEQLVETSVALFTTKIKPSQLRKWEREAQVASSIADAASCEAHSNNNNNNNNENTSVSSPHSENNSQSTSNNNDDSEISDASAQEFTSNTTTTSSNNNNATNSTNNNNSNSIATQAMGNTPVVEKRAKTKHIRRARRTTGTDLAHETSSARESMVSSNGATSTTDVTQSTDLTSLERWNQRRKKKSHANSGKKTASLASFDRPTPVSTGN